MKISGVECASVWCENTDLYIMVRCIWNMTMKACKAYFKNWTGTLTNERVSQSLIGGRKGVFVDCSKATAEEVVRT